MNLARRMGGDGRWSATLAVAPDIDAARGYRWPPRLNRIAQGPGNLGDRMGRVMAALPPGPVVIIGADIPEIAPGHIARAFRLLGANDAVFGPAPDGGYWLVGLKRRPRIQDIFAAVRWSSPDALADTVANLPAARIAYLDPLADIDDGEAYRDWAARRRGTT
ncbi:MAG: hypothetical protein CMM10_11905 [Rhodospirillaceae bacterium]|nr:hypothetical protein [Rhodospirillaceae bacterium]